MLNITFKTIRNLFLAENLSLQHTCALVLTSLPVAGSCWPAPLSPLVLWTHTSAMLEVGLYNTLKHHSVRQAYCHIGRDYNLATMIEQICHLSGLRSGETKLISSEHVFRMKLLLSWLELECFTRLISFSSLLQTISASPTST